MANSKNILTDLPQITVELKLVVDIEDIPDEIPDEWWHGKDRDDLVFSTEQLFKWLLSKEGQESLKTWIDDYAYVEVRDAEISKISVPDHGWSTKVE